MKSKKAQHKVGIPAKRRGQQIGYAGNPDQNREKSEATPARRGKRPRVNKQAADVSAQNISSSSVTPSTNTPSTPAMNVPHGGAGGGERVFKKRLAKKRARKS